MTLPDTAATTARYLFGDDTTIVTTPAGLSVALAPDDRQPTYQDTASFLVRAADGAVAFEITASHFSSGNRAANLGKFQGIVHGKRDGAGCPQVVMGDINTEVTSAEALQALADASGLVAIIPSLKIRKRRGLQDQLHKRMDMKDTYDSMFMMVAPGLVDAEALAALDHQNVAWPGEPSRGRWLPADVAPAWADDRILTDHGVLKCPLKGGLALGLDNAARANYDKYDIKNEAAIARRAYLEGQQILERCVADAVIEFIGALPLSDTLDADTRAQVLDGLGAYRVGMAAYYKAAYAAWDDADDLCSDQTPLGQALRALGQNAKRFVSITRALSWEDIRDAPAARAALKAGLTDALVAGLGVGADDPALPLGANDAFQEAPFRQSCEGRIDAAFDRIIKRRAAGDLYKLWFAEVLQGQTTGGMPIPAAALGQPTEDYIAGRRRALGLSETICVTVEALR